MKKFIHQIAENCPVGDRLAECAVYDLANTRKDLLQFLDKMSDSEAQSLIARHRECLRNRCSILLNSNHTVQSWNRVSLM